jgi:hypothetical protein
MSSLPDTLWPNIDCHDIVVDVFSSPLVHRHRLERCKMSKRSHASGQASDRLVESRSEASWCMYPARKRQEGCTYKLNLQPCVASRPPKQARGIMQPRHGDPMTPCIFLQTPGSFASSPMDLSTLQGIIVAMESHFGLASSK